MGFKRAAEIQSPSVEPSDDGRKRQRTDSTQSWQNTSMTSTATRPPAPLTEEEQDQLKKWLDKKANADEFPFPITYPKPDAKSPGKPRKGGNRKSLTNGHQEKKAKESLVLDEHKYGEIAFTVGNKAKWEQLTKYRRCTVSEQTFVVSDCVLVRCDEPAGFDTLSQWKAQIHEIRALDANHVYLRVSWLYRPAYDLPGGPKSYHGSHELVPSNYMDIIDAKTINAPLNIVYWDEYKDEDNLAQEYYWRQSYDHTTDKLTECRGMCSCAQPQNPDLKIVQCPKCSEWMHAKCIELDVHERYLAANPGKGAANGKSEQHPKLDSQIDPQLLPAQKAAQRPAKKARTSKLPDLRSETSSEGVSCTLSEDKGNIVITLEDTRGDGNTIEESTIRCLLCEHSFEG